MIHRLIILTLIQFSLLMSQTQIAIVDFDALGVSKNDAIALSERLSNELLNTGQFKVLERQKLNKIIEEQKFQLSGLTSDEYLVELGNFANVQQIVAGSIGKVGTVYAVTARLINVETGELLRTGKYDHQGNIGQLMLTGMASIASQLASIPTTMVQTKSNSKNTTSPETVTDIDGNVYKTVRIGDQVWMAENLKVTHYRNGDIIPNLIKRNDWGNAMSGAYCSYNNRDKVFNTYGALYNWHAISDARRIAPVGWHVPTDAEWKELEMYLGMSKEEVNKNGGIKFGTIEGGKLKEEGTSHWASPNKGATNESGFNALPGGIRFGNQPLYLNLGSGASFWTATEIPNYAHSAFSYGLWANSSDITRAPTTKISGISVRCVKD